MHSCIYLGADGKGFIQAEGDRGGLQILGMGANMVNLRQVWHNNCGILPSLAHGKHPRQEFGADPGGEHQGRGEGDLQGFLPPNHNFSGLSG